MARLLTCGFELGTLSEMNGAVGVITPTVSNTYYRTGAYGCVLRSASSYIGHAFGSNLTEFYMRTAVMFTGLGVGVDSNFLLFKDNAGDELFTLFFNSGTQTLDIQRNSVQLAAGTFAITANRWYVLEGHVVIDASTGVASFKLDNATHVAFSGDTLGSGASGMRSVLYKGAATTTIADYIVIDDVAYNDTTGSYQNSWVGMGGVYFLKANGEGNTQEFTPSAGTVHYSLVDDVPANTTDWVQGDTSGQTEQFEVEDTPDYITTVDLVEVVCQAAIVESGYQTIRDTIRQGTVDYSGTVTTTITAITDSYIVVKSEPYYTQRSGTAAWTTGEVDAIQAGWEIP